MATKIVHTSNNVQRTTLSHEPAARKLQGPMPELRRLATFRSRNANMHPTLSKGLLAKNGFCYKDAENKAICEACDFEIELSISANDLIEKHMEQSPECQFVVNRNEIFPATNQLTSFSILDMSQTNNSDSNHQNSVNQDQIIPEKSFLNSLSDEAINKLRASTFSNWPLITPNAQDMIVAGWSYTNIADRVICIYCDALYHKWTESDRPYEIHRLKSPKCPFVLLAEKKAPVAPTTSITITTEPTTQAAVGAVNTAYALSCRRYESFNNWPQNEDKELPSIETFVDAGFYYEGDKTIVRCFYCNGALRNWQTGDDPKVEHARWYPHCAYIRQYIGEDLYQAIQRKNRELKAQQKYSGSTNTQTSQIAPWTDDETDRMVKARLDLPVVEKLRQAGFSMAIIRKSFEMQLKFKKDDFKTDNDLQLACLILDRQVKLINGNEANLLVPEEWLKKFIEDQAQGMQQSETSKPQILSIQVPKISPPILPGPKIIQQSDKEAMPCVLCLTAERQVACLPCGHLTSCVACGHSLKTCPICRATIKAFVRIYA